MIVVLVELAPDHVLLAYQDDLDSQTPGGANRPFDLGRWGMIAAHCIYGNGQHVRKILLLFDFHYLAAFILATVGANAMREFRLMAVRTFRQTGGLQGIV